MRRRRRRMFVTIQVQAWLPRPQKKDPTKLTKKTFEQWVTVGRAPVLYHDSKIVLVRQFGSESLYHPSGDFELAGFNRNHPQAKNIPASHGRFRLHPDSVKALAVTRVFG